jgi:hypothetical protein
LALTLERDAAADRLAAGLAEAWFGDLVAADFADAGFVVADFVVAALVAADFVAVDFVAADLVAASTGITASMAPTTNQIATPTYRDVPLDPRTASPPMWRRPAPAVTREVVPRSETRINTDSPQLPCCFVHPYHGIRKETVTLEQHGPKCGLKQADLKVPFRRPRLCFI